MKLVGIPTAIIHDEESGELQIQASVISGPDKRNICWHERNRCVFPITHEDQYRDAFAGYAQVVEEVIAGIDSASDVKPIITVGREGDADVPVRNLTLKIGLLLKEILGERINVNVGTFGDSRSGMKTSERNTPCTVEEAYDNYLNDLRLRLESATDLMDRIHLWASLRREQRVASDVLIGYFQSHEKLRTLQDHERISDAYVPYYEDLLRRAETGEPSAITELETEMRHAALRLFVEFSPMPQERKAKSTFILTTSSSDILSLLPYRAGDHMRRIYAHEIRKLFGISGNISVKSSHLDPKSPYFGDLLTVALADEADLITGEPPDEVRLQIPEIA